LNPAVEGDQRACNKVLYKQLQDIAYKVLYKQLQDIAYKVLYKQLQDIAYYRGIFSQLMAAEMQFKITG